MKRKLAYGYLRVSGKGQMKQDKHGFERQREAIESFAKKSGFQVVRYYQEAVSGCKVEDERKEFMEMVSTILRENGVRNIIVEGMDRLARELRVQEQLIFYLASKEIDLYSANTGENITKSIKEDPVKKALVQIQGVFAELEKSRLVKKLRKARESARKRDGKCEGRKEYGYYEGEQEGIELMKKLHRKQKGRKRMSYQKIADELNKQGIASRVGKVWHPQTVYNIINRKDR